MPPTGTHAACGQPLVSPVVSSDPFSAQRQALGSFIRAQRRMANLSLRQMAELTKLSHPYLSQLERGLHEPSVRALKGIAEALDVSAETLLAHLGLSDEEGSDSGVEAAIRADRRLSPAQQEALIAVYRSYVAAAEGDGSA